MDDEMDTVVSRPMFVPQLWPLQAVFVCGGCSIDVSAESIEILNEDKPGDCFAGVSQWEEWVSIRSLGSVLSLSYGFP